MLNFLFFQMNTGVSPNYISSLISASVEDSTTYTCNLRNANNFSHTLSRTQLYFRSFLPSSIRAWKDLSLEVRQSNSIQSFKYQLNQNFKKALIFIHWQPNISDTTYPTKNQLQFSQSSYFFKTYC